MSLIWAKTRNFNVLRKLTLEQKYMETMHSSLQGEAGVKAGGWTWRIGANHRSGIRLFIIRLTIMKKYTPSSNPIIWVVLHFCPCPLKKMMIPIIQLYHIISYPNCNTFFPCVFRYLCFVFSQLVFMCVCVCPMWCFAQPPCIRHAVEHFRSLVGRVAADRQMKYEGFHKLI